MANDAATRAATSDAPPLDVDRGRGAPQPRASLASRQLGWDLEDADGDGRSDTVVLEVVTRPPRFLPASLGGVAGLDEIRRTVRVRTEALR